MIEALEETNGSTREARAKEFLQDMLTQAAKEQWCYAISPPCDRGETFWVTRYASGIASSSTSPTLLKPSRTSFTSFSALKSS